MVSAGPCGFDIDLPAETFLLDHILEDELGQRAAADVAVTDE